MTKRVITIGVMLAVFATGCGNSDEKSAPAAETTLATPTVALSPEEGGATVEQYASVIARSSDLPATLDQMSDCDWGGSGSLDYDPALFVCEVGLLTMSYSAQTLNQNLLNARNPAAAEGFIGDPPDEIGSLVAETIDGSLVLGNAATNADDAKCGQSGRGQCGVIRGQVFQALNSLQSTLAAWQPYL